MHIHTSPSHLTHHPPTPHLQHAHIAVEGEGLALLFQGDHRLLPKELFVHIGVCLELDAMLGVWGRGGAGEGQVLIAHTRLLD